MRGIVLSRLKLHSLTTVLNLHFHPGKNNSKYLAHSLYTWSQCKGLLQTTHDLMVNQKRYKVPPLVSTISVYDPAKPTPEHEGTLLDEVSDGLEIVKRDIPVLKEQLIDEFAIHDSLTEHGDFIYFEKFDSQHRIDEWIVTTDGDTDQGKSSANLKHTDKNTALFQGYINKEVPKDGYTERAGYCSIASPYNKKAFEKVEVYDWSIYSHIYLKVRGDGRNYMLLVHMDRIFDINYYDVYSYPLYTRGGPYWQYVKVPLAHFMLTFKGRVQTQQEMIQSDKVKYFSIASGDFEGSFNLEIDFIALLYDESCDERNDFKYEMYRKETYIW